MKHFKVYMEVRKIMQMKLNCRWYLASDSSSLHHMLRFVRFHRQSARWASNSWLLCQVVFSSILSWWLNRFVRSLIRNEAVSYLGICGKLSGGAARCSVAVAVKQSISWFIWWLALICWTCFASRLVMFFLWLNYLSSTVMLFLCLSFISVTVDI